MGERKAVVFDLDDTLYPRQRFVMSGFRAVAAHLGTSGGLDPVLTFETLVAAQAREPGRELQALVGRVGLAADAVARLVDVIRSHVPELRLPELSRAVLRTLRPTWRLGIVTNGLPDIQERKVRALELAPRVDAVVYAGALGEGRAKPHAASFLEAARRLGVPPAACVFVGDDPVADMAGARAVGMATVWLAPGTRGQPEADVVAADVVASSLADVPAAVGRLVPRTRRGHVD